MQIIGYTSCGNTGLVHICHDYFAHFRISQLSFSLDENGHWSCTRTTSPFVYLSQLIFGTTSCVFFPVSPHSYIVVARVSYTLSASVGVWVYWSCLRAIVYDPQNDREVVCARVACFNYYRFFCDTPVIFTPFLLKYLNTQELHAWVRSDENIMT